MSVHPQKQSARWAVIKAQAVPNWLSCWLKTNFCFRGSSALLNINSKLWWCSLSCFYESVLLHARQVGGPTQRYRISRIKKLYLLEEIYHLIGYLYSSIKLDGPSWENVLEQCWNWKKTLQYWILNNVMTWYVTIYIFSSCIHKILTLTHWFQIDCWYNSSLWQRNCSYIGNYCGEQAKYTLSILLNR